MRNKVAKSLKLDVVFSLYGADLMPDEVRAILKEPKFKKIYRARKVNYLRNKARQHPKLIGSKRQTRITKKPINNE